MWHTMRLFDRWLLALVWWILPYQIIWIFNPDVVIANETCISSDLVEDDILPSNYTSIRDDKCATKHGVLIAHKMNLFYFTAGSHR